MKYALLFCLLCSTALAEIVTATVEIYDYYWYGKTDYVQGYNIYDYEWRQEYQVIMTTNSPYTKRAIKLDVAYNLGAMCENFGELDEFHYIFYDPIVPQAPNIYRAFCDGTMIVNNLSSWDNDKRPGKHCEIASYGPVYKDANHISTRIAWAKMRIKLANADPLRDYSVKVRTVGKFHTVGGCGYGGYSGYPASIMSCIGNTVPPSSLVVCGLIPDSNGDVTVTVKGSSIYKTCTPLFITSPSNKHWTFGQEIISVVQQ